MSKPMTVGLVPWLPWPLSRMPWWTEPVRAERLAALRIGLGVAILADISIHYLPAAPTLVGNGGLGGPTVFPTGAWPTDLNRWLQGGLGSIPVGPAILTVWGVVAVGLVLGLASRLNAVLAWLLGACVLELNPWATNSGDRTREILLFYLMLTPCGAVWSLDRWWRRHPPGPVLVAPWWLRLLFIQLVIAYFVAGLAKLSSEAWRDGTAMHNTFSNLAWSRIPYVQLPLGETLASCLTWLTMGWELSFPVLVLNRWTRTPALLMGAFFHIATGVLLRLGPFPIYMLCFYLPLLPWENYVRRGEQGDAAPASVPAPST